MSDGRESLKYRLMGSKEEIGSLKLLSLRRFFIIIRIQSHLTCMICTKSVDFLAIHTLKFCTELLDKSVSIFFDKVSVFVYLYYYTLVHSTLPECVDKSSGPFVF